MARSVVQYVCQECGTSHGKWSGQCSACAAWNTLVEESAGEAVPKGMKLGRGRELELVSLEGDSKFTARRSSGINEFDRVCGGGIVPGSAILVGGDPGIGKSTLLLQVVAALSNQVPCLYISGEEAVDQVRLRAERLHVRKAPVQLATATNIRDIITTLQSKNAPNVLVIDSIQTMYVDSLDSAPGTVSQVRACAQELIRIAKKCGLTLILVGHVTKEGMIAGPRVLEHMVDTVLYFEGDRGHQFRILRAVKNRFGPTDEIGVFEMTQQGLAEVANPSALFLAERSGDISGASVFAGIEGTRPVLVEIQALVAPSTFGTPRRTVIGWDSGRLAMILAVLEARCGVVMSGMDVYLNIAGGLRLHEPAVDLAVAAALLSGLSRIAMPKDVVIFGEIGLSGEIRVVGQTDARLKEASKLGFSGAFVPKQRKSKNNAHNTLKLTELVSLNELVAFFNTFETSFNQKVKTA
ncbi:MAG: DNA repair protein RadA [Alphaproteobacteria bacterium]|nr:DNA repair protein RadA [Alphaproteobacteria bacterium]